jgi:hypothetical protein
VRTFNTSRFLFYSLIVCAGIFDPAASRAASNDQPWRSVDGRAFYEKIEVNDNGLDLTHPVVTAIRNARVEVIDPATKAVLSVSQTDPLGQFKVLAPVQSKATVRVLSRLRESNVRVLDNINGNTLYAAASDLNPEDSSVVVVARDATRANGAFNILEMLQEGNELLHLMDAQLVLPDVTVLWSPLNRPASSAAKEAIGSTYFDRRTNTISLVGDRSVDSDEFDDSVILHEYGHLVATAFSRDSSPGGVHLLGDALDPRLAWSEGWANFFSSAVRNAPVFLDSYGPNGSRVVRFDLRDVIPQGAGYWSEYSVHSILWSLYAAQSFQPVWTAFTDLKNDHFVYFPYFLEHYLDRNPQVASDLATIVRLRSIDFHPETRPSVPNPFPQPINVGQVVTGTIDSLSTQRKELLHSSDFFIFQSAGGPTSIRMDITGLGPGNNANANDLDIFLYGLDGHLISFSDRGLNGESELIPALLGQDSYVVEVRSYYDSGENKGKNVFNSGSYNLIVRTP